MVLVFRFILGFGFVFPLAFVCCWLWFTLCFGLFDLIRGFEFGEFGAMPQNGVFLGFDLFVSLCGYVFA